MSYQLEREMLDRVARYQSEAALWRSVPQLELRLRLAATLRRMADRIEDREAGSGLAGEQAKVVLQGRTHL